MSDAFWMAFFTLATLIVKGVFDEISRRQIKKKVDENTATLDRVDQQTNGLSAQLQAQARAAGLREGHDLGVIDERSRPQQPPAQP